VVTSSPKRLDEFVEATDFEPMWCARARHWLCLSASTTPSHISLVGGAALSWASSGGRQLQTPGAAIGRGVRGGPPLGGPVPQEPGQGSSGAAVETRPQPLSRRCFRDLTGAACRGPTRIRGRIDLAESEELFLGEDVSADLLHEWLAFSKQAIAFAETLAVVAATGCFEKLLARRRFFYFLDTNRAQASYISFKPRQPDLREILLQFAIRCRDALHFPWFARVPSVADPADDPSRLADERLSALPGVRRARLEPELLRAAAGRGGAASW